MKNGFTLIELLAVIVVLAIIALIAVPVVLNIINDAKESSILRSAEFYLDAASYTIADAFLYHGGLTNGQYPITSTGDICKVNETTCSESNILKVEVSGDKPTGGYIELNGGVISNVKLVLDDRTIVQDTDGTLIYQTTPALEKGKLSTICEYQNNGVAEKTEGSKYSCKVDPNRDPYTFYVLTTPSNTDTSINLIMDRNICSDGTVATESNTCYVAWTSDEYLEEHAPQEDLVNYENLNIYGPVTAMEYLSNATKTWTNTNKMTVDKFDNDDGTEFDMQAYNTYARLPYLSELKSYNGNNNYLYENLSSENWAYDDGQPTNKIANIDGYWTFSSSVNSYDAWCASSGGFVEYIYVGIGTDLGVRPVINLKL